MADTTENTKLTLSQSSAFHKPSKETQGPGPEDIAKSISAFGNRQTDRQIERRKKDERGKISERAPDLSLRLGRENFSLKYRCSCSNTCSVSASFVFLPRLRY
jgi:hypothetical protein